MAEEPQNWFTGNQEAFIQRKMDKIENKHRSEVKKRIRKKVNGPLIHTLGLLPSLISTHPHPAKGRFLEPESIPKMREEIKPFMTAYWLSRIMTKEQRIDFVNGVLWSEMKRGSEESKKEFLERLPDLVDKYRAAVLERKESQTLRLEEREKWASLVSSFQSRFKKAITDKMLSEDFSTPLPWTARLQIGIKSWVKENREPKELAELIDQLHVSFSEGFQDRAEREAPFDEEESLFREAVDTYFDEKNVQGRHDLGRVTGRVVKDFSERKEKIVSLAPIDNEEIKELEVKGEWEKAGGRDTRIANSLTERNPPILQGSKSNGYDLTPFGKVVKAVVESGWPEYGSGWPKNALAPGSPDSIEYVDTETVDRALKQLSQWREA